MWQSTNVRTGLARWHTLLAEAYGKAGEYPTGLRELEKAIALVEQTGDRHYEVETYRLRGVLLLQQHAPNASLAEVCFLKALDVARRQQAKSFELRTAIELSKLWKREGKHEDAYTLLASIYSWFTEGVNTSDIQEAKRLLETHAC